MYAIRSYYVGLELHLEANRIISAATETGLRLDILDRSELFLYDVQTRIPPMQAMVSTGNTVNDLLDQTAFGEDVTDALVHIDD